MIVYGRGDEGEGMLLLFTCKGLWHLLGKGKGPKRKAEEEKEGG